MFNSTIRERILNFSAGQEVRQEISRGGLVREIYLRLTQQPTVAGAANTAAAVQRGNGWGVIRRLEIVLNGSDTILSLPGYALPVLAGLQMRRFPALTATLGDGATANPSLDDSLVIPFLQPFAAKPLDTLLDLRRVRLAEVRVLWGTHLNVSSGATAYTTAPSLEVSTYKSIPTPAEIPDNQIFTEWRRYLQEVTAPAVTVNQRIDLSTGYVYRGCIIETENNGTQSGAILNELRVKSGATVFQDMRAVTMREIYRTRYGISDIGASAGYSRGQNNLDGWYVWDQITEGRLAEAIDTQPFSEFFLEANVTGGANIRANLFPWILIPPRAPAA